MILLTGATNFIGRAVLQVLRRADLPVRILLEPSSESPDLPAGVAADVSVASLSDERSVRSALVGISQVIHIGNGYYSSDPEKIWQESKGTRVLAQSAQAASVSRFVYLSHLGADRMSAYPELRAKAEGEGAIRMSGVPFTIVRSGLVYGAGDSFTSILVALIRRVPFVTMLPGNPETLAQPLWVQELAVAVQWILEDEKMADRAIEIGGPEFLSLREMAFLVQQQLRKRSFLLPLSPPVLKFITPLFTPWLLGQDGGEFWIDYFAVNRTTELDAMPRLLGIQPSRMGDCLNYLEHYR
ncbi:MAG: NAD(P)H-binding protein [Anaerolineales bacterium]|nr:NAD(P)H-binding protein [Anaerolineales bacterium]